MNHQLDMRARLFRERNPSAFELLTHPNPPVLEKVPIDITPEEAGRIAAKVLTIGEEEFRQAELLARAGETRDAVAAFERLRIRVPGQLDRAGRNRAAQDPEALASGEPTLANRSNRDLEPALPSHCGGCARARRAMLG